jgi:hypothetical protein
MRTGYTMSTPQNVILSQNGANIAIFLSRQTTGGLIPSGGTAGGGPRRPTPVTLTVAVNHRERSGRTYPVANAQVTILQSGRRLSVFRTDRNGNGNVPLLPGRYDVVATASNFKERRVSVNLTRSDRVSVSLQPTLL